MVQGGQCGPGKIRQLVELIDEHTDAFAYDWRARFGLSIESMFTGQVSWGEAWSLTTQLLSDPTSHLFASVAEWAHPASLEFKVLADLYDLTLYKAVGKKGRSKVKPMTRPWPDANAPRRSKTQLPQQIIRAALAARGHSRAIAATPSTVNTPKAISSGQSGKRSRRGNGNSQRIRKPDSVL